MTSQSVFNQTCDRARAKFAQHRGGKIPKDLFEQQRWTMCNAHTVFVESFENMYNLADKIPPAEEQDFTFYCLTAVQGMHHHHALEEDIYFPGLEPEVQIDIATDHHTFTGLLHDLEVFLESILGKKGDTKVAYDGPKIKGYLDRLCEPMFDHLIREIDLLDAQTLRASGLSVERLRQIDQAMDKKIRSDLDPYTTLVFATYHVPPGSDFPPLPFVFKRILIPWWFYWRYSKSWRYFPKLNN